MSFYFFDLKRLPHHSFEVENSQNWKLPLETLVGTPAEFTNPQPYLAILSKYNVTMSHWHIQMSTHSDIIMSMCVCEFRQKFPYTQMLVSFFSLYVWVCICCVTFHLQQWQQQQICSREEKIKLKQQKDSIVTQIVNTPPTTTTTQAIQTMNEDNLSLHF